MKGFAGVAVAALCAVSVVEAGCYPKDGYRPPKMTFEEKLELAVNYEPVDAANHHMHFPRHFDWEDVEGINYLAPSWNQHIPEYCGSCWLHGTLSSVQDRIKIMAKAKGPDVMLARQTLLQCGILANMSNGCHGGEPRNVFDYMHKFGLPDETCMLYRANDTAFMHLKKENKLCPQEGICVNCMHGHTPECWAIEKPLLYSVKSYGPVEPNVQAIMAEIFHRGPVVCSMASTDHFDYQYHGGVYIDPNNATDVNHDVEIVGWGEDEDGTPYWRVRNSWGTYWGEKGFFRIRRGTNELMIENDCWYAIPDMSMERELDAGKLVGDMVKGLIKNPKWEEMEKKIKEWEKKMEEEKKKEEEEIKKRVEEAKKMEEERKKEAEKMREEMKKKMEEREKALEKIREEIEHIREEQEEEFREHMRERIQRLREEAERRRQHMQQMFGEETVAQRMQHVEDSAEEPTVRLASHL